MTDKGSRPADFPPPFDWRDFVAEPTDPPDERIDVGVLIVGAGPAGLAAAVRIGQLLEERPDVREQLGDVPVAVVEKARAPGAHLLSGAVVNSLKPLSELQAGNVLGLPGRWTIEPWIEAWATACTGAEKCTGLSRYFTDSLLVVVPATVISTLWGCFNGYVLAKWRFRGVDGVLFLLMFGVFMPAALFAIALLACGLNSTVTATMAGQIVMEGFLDIRLAPWLRRLVTRMVAIVPAIGVTLLYGEGQTAKLLILSQVILSFQLPFAIVPLVQFTASRAKMGSLVAPRWLTVLAAVIAAVIIGLNVKLLYDLAVGI